MNRKNFLKTSMVVVGIALFFWGAKASESQSLSTGSASVPSEMVPDTNGDGLECLDLTGESLTSEQPMTGLTCADMGWYEHNEKEACDYECGHDCVKKQWCGTGLCEPWPHYCWKCS